MRQFSKIEMNQTDYAVRFITQVENKNLFMEQQHGSRKNLLVHGFLVATTSPNGGLDLGGLEKREFTSFLGLFTRKLYSQFYKFPELHSLDVRFMGTARGKNRINWEDMPVGHIFFNLDLSSAYWQILYYLNYIDKKMFDSYINSKRHKTAKRFCVSFLARNKKTTYHNPDGSTYEIQCNTEVLKKVYSNVRKELYRTIQGALNGSKTYLEYNIDGVTVLPEDLEVIKQYFNSRGLTYKTTICTKINATQYQYGKEIKNFITTKNN